MDELLPDKLKNLWQSVARDNMTPEGFQQEQERLLAEYRMIWKEALILDGQSDLEASLLYELSRYVQYEDLDEIRRRCRLALSDVKGEWEGKVDRGDRGSVEQFYNESQAMMYELMWWHTLNDDDSPMAYVVALQFARSHGCRHYLDFGVGVGSGPVLFARHGMEVTAADISSQMLDFTRWRLAQRRLDGRFIDLKQDHLPDEAFDMVTAMDVFEHLVDPVAVADDVCRALKPGGFLFGRFHAELDEERPHHIVQDFSPTIRRLEANGLVEVWRDEWLWGHQVFQKK
jgi:SAM-dependent methyltransferase